MAVYSDGAKHDVAFLADPVDNVDEEHFFYGDGTRLYQLGGASVAFRFEVPGVW